MEGGVAVEGDRGLLYYKLSEEGVKSGEVPEIGRRVGGLEVLGEVDIRSTGARFGGFG